MSYRPFDGVIRGRMIWVLALFFIAFSALIIRLFILQIVQHEDYSRLASRQYKPEGITGPERGAIFAKDREGNKIPLAFNKTYKTAVISPINIREPEKVVEVLSSNLGIDEKIIREKMAKIGDPYEVVARRVDVTSAERVAVLNLAGVFFEEERRRVYPHGTLAAHLLGFASKEEEDEAGRYGLERFYNPDLAGERGIFEGVRDATGFWLALGRRIMHPSRDGSELYLTLDYNIQLKSEEILEGVKKKWGAPSAAILVMEPATGRILALASRPAFDPNKFSEETDYSVFLNPLVEAIYELGSVMKPVVMAGGLEEKLITPQSTYEDPGEIKIGGYTIKNFDGRAYKIQTMTQVLEKSLNTGAVYVSRLLGKDRHLEYIQKFGLGDKTGIDFPGESAGNISNLGARRDIDFATASFGQGIAVTPIQMAMAMGAIANDGKLMKPHVVEKIIDDSGNEIKKDPETVRQVISQEAAEELTKMLVSAVRSGFENRAGVKGYFVAGKTGTAQIPRSDGPGYSDRVIHTFAGYAPAFDPKFLIYLQLNEPRGNRFAANTLTPAFHDLAEYILNYYEVPPDEQ